LVIERAIAAATHGRYLVAPPEHDRPSPMLVGFHGYGEGAEAQLERLRSIPGAERWVIVSIQGLHRFYQRRTNEVIASWMTRQDRELAMADNLAYVNAVMDAVAAEWPTTTGAVFAGFSQGVAMSFRAAAHTPRPVAAVIAAGGDVPPELDATALGRVKAALICRGVRDDWYASSKFGEDRRRLGEAGVDVRPLEFDGGHEWSDPVVRAAAELLRDVLRRGTA
jgi:predicted esterase